MACSRSTMVSAGLHGHAGLPTIIHFPFPSPETYVTKLLDAHLGGT